MVLRTACEKRPSFLVVERDAGDLRLIVAALQDLPVEILMTGRGLEGRELVQARQPDFVILDLATSDLDGYELFRRIREGPETAETTVIVTHPDPGETELFRAFSLRSDCFLGKPFCPEHLVRFISRLLEAPRERPWQDGETR